MNRVDGEEFCELTNELETKLKADYTTNMLVDLLLNKTALIDCFMIT